MRNSFNPKCLSIAFFLLIFATACGRDDQQPPPTSDSPSLEQSTGSQDISITEEISSTSQVDKSHIPTKTQSPPNLTKHRKTGDDPYYTSNSNAIKEPPSFIQKLKNQVKKPFTFSNLIKKNKQATKQPKMQAQAKKKKGKAEEEKKAERKEAEKKKEEKKKKEQKAKEKAEKKKKKE